MTRLGRLLWAGLFFDFSTPLIPRKDITFTKRIDEIFHPKGPISQLKVPKSFSHNLLDILEVELDIEPTTSIRL